MRLRERRRWTCALGVALSGALMLSGCGAEPAPPVTETSVEPSTPAAGGGVNTPTSTQTPTSAPPAEPVVLPACDVMNTTAQQEYEDFGVEMFSEPAGETDLATFSELSGPAAQAAMAEVVAQRGCRWPIHSQGTITQYVAELPKAAQTPLIDALRADTAVTETSLGAAVSFSYESAAPNGYMSATEITHIFLGDVWIAVFDYAGQREYATAALDGVLAANPTLNVGGAEPPADASGECAQRDGQAALAELAPTVADGPWDATGQFSDASGYDACAALSWIVLRPEPCCTRFSITPVLFFHEGEYVPSATITTFAIDSEAPAVRISDDSVDLTFMWPGSDIAGPANTAVSSYTWDDAAGVVRQSGDLPPS